MCLICCLASTSLLNSYWLVLWHLMTSGMTDLCPLFSRYLLPQNEVILTLMWHVQLFIPTKQESAGLNSVGLLHEHLQALVSLSCPQLATDISLSFRTGACFLIEQHCLTVSQLNNNQRNFMPFPTYMLPLEVNLNIRNTTSPRPIFPFCWLR